jgi:hypothetical protein
VPQLNNEFIKRTSTSTRCEELQMPKIEDLRADLATLGKKLQECEN